MDFSVKQVVPVQFEDNERPLAYADVVFEEALLVNGFRLDRTEEGNLRLIYRRKQSGSEEEANYRIVARPIDKALEKQLIQDIYRGYQTALEEELTESSPAEPATRGPGDE